jgi:probable HAF family extracellular repeat protein
MRHRALGLAAAPAKGDYVVVDLGSFGGDFTEAWGLNNRDEVVGRACDEQNRPVAFLWQDERVTRLPMPPGATEAVANDITDDGVICGNAVIGWLHALVWTDPAKRAKDIGTVGGPAAGTQGMNRPGAVVGNSRRAGDLLWCPYLWSNGTMTTIDTPNGGGGIAFGINDRGDVVGNYSTVPGKLESPFRAFLWSDGVVRDLGTLGGEGAVAYDVNDARQVVGHAATKDGVARPFLWADGQMRDLGTLGGTWSTGYRINRSGVVVGESTLAAGGTRAFVFRDGVMTDLNALLAPDSGWTLTSARDINDHGCIVGFGLHHGAKRAFLLMLRKHPPAPKPD